MNWLIAMGLGACGGAVVEALTFSARVQAWQQSRHQALARGRALKPLTKFVDPVADSLALFTRLGLGALSGFLFHTEVSGALAAIMVGASAPALLRQLGTVQSITGADLRLGAVPGLIAPKQTTDPNAAATRDGRAE